MVEEYGAAHGESFSLETIKDALGEIAGLSTKLKERIESQQRIKKAQEETP